MTLIDVRSDALEVICTGGDHMLGGKNWDEMTATWLAQQFSNEHGVPEERLTGDRETWQALMSDAERIKFGLSTRESMPVKVQFEGGRSTVELTRAKFDELTRDLLERTVSLTKELLATAWSEGYSRVDLLLLVGGSTYMPQVMAAVKENFSCEMRQFDPNQAVGKGAALFGYKCFLDAQVRYRIAQKTGKTSHEVDAGAVPEDVRAAAEQEVAKELGVGLPDIRKFTRRTVTTVTAKSFGIVVVDPASDEERVCNLIKTNSALPTSICRQFRTHFEDQEGVVLRCMENTERVGPGDALLSLDTSTEVGSTELRFARALPKGSLLEVTFSLTEDGRLNVRGRDLTTHQEVDAEFRTTGILTLEEMEEHKRRNSRMVVS